MESISVAGTPNDWVTGYNLMYSTGGVTWNFYEDSNVALVKDLNSFCYKGECSGTLSNQCRSLWGAGRCIVNSGVPVFSFASGRVSYVPPPPS